MELVVEDSGTDEEQSARGDNRATVVIRAGISFPLGHQLRILSERNLPQILACVHVDRTQTAPGRRRRGIVIWIEKATKSDGFIRHVIHPGAAQTWGRWRRRSLPRLRRSALLLRVLGEVLNDRCYFVIAQAVEGRHAASSLLDDGCDLSIGADTFDAAQGRNFGRCAGSVDAVAHAALILVDALAHTSRRRR